MAVNKLLYILIVLLFSGRTIFAENDRGTIAGRIIDQNTKSVLPGATIRLEGTAYGSLTNKNGEFQIKNIRRMKYNSIITYVGYETKKLLIDLNKDDSLYVTIELHEEIIHTSEVVVSANKRLQSVQDVPISMSVVVSKELDERNIIHVDEALIYIPGVNLVRDQVSIRGSSGFALGLGSRVAFLMDGMPLVSGDQGDIKFDAIPIFNLDRIEVVKGAGSALYGTGALGGVINIITKEPKDIPEIRLQTYGGIYAKPKYGQWNYSDKTSSFEGLNAGYSEKLGPFGIIVSGGLNKDESYRDFDESHKWNLFSKIKYDISERSTVNVIGTYAYDNFENWVYWNSLDSALIPPSTADRNVRNTSTKLTVSGEGRHIFKNGDFIILRSGLFSTDFHNNLPTDSAEYHSSQANSINSEIQVSNKIFENTLLTYGLNHVLNSVSANIYGNKIQNILAGYFQGELSFINNLILTAGARIDYEKINGEDSNNFEFSPKLGLSFTSPWGPIFRTSFGRGFRAATVAEKYASLKYNGFSVIPNPELIPEVSWSYEVGVNQLLNIGKTQLFYDISIFQNDFSNLIEPKFDLSSTSAIIFNNITKARIQGIEINVKTMLFNALGIESALTYMDPVDKTINDSMKIPIDTTFNKTLKYRSKILWYNRLIIPFDFLEFQLDHRYMSMIENIDDRLILLIKDSDKRVPVNVLDARLILELSKLTDMPLTVTLNAKNLLNYYYIEMVGNLAPVRNFSLQVEAMW
ncbi:MAG: TonB-dependent receptor [Ignavibacteriae bacterium]|nr:TonB-dependent receptor [Ignavibacteriota bacterium]